MYSTFEWNSKFCYPLLLGVACCTGSATAVPLQTTSCSLTKLWSVLQDSCTVRLVLKVGTQLGSKAWVTQVVVGYTDSKAGATICIVSCK